jgi:hypothetical protein
VYPFYAIPDWYGTGGYVGLDGTNFFSTFTEPLGEPGPDGLPPQVRSLVDDGPIVEYLNKVEGQPVICEANEQYAESAFGRISVTTGLPCIFNWYLHEYLWRTIYKISEFSARIADIETIYTTDDISAAKAALAKYNAKYVVVGLLERTRFPGMINDDLLKSLGAVVVQSNDSYLVEVQYDGEP